jgi:hypothetical protein
LGELDPLSRKSVYVRTLVESAAEARQIAPTEIVGVEKDEVRLLVLSGVERGKYRDEQKDQMNECADRVVQAHLTSPQESC